MRTILIGIVLYALVSVSARAVPTGNPHCLYHSPASGSRLVSPSSGIIIRFDQPVASASLRNAAISVVGSSSGAITGSLRLSDDGVTVLFKPQEKFTHGDTVHVDLAGGIQAADGADLGRLTWKFIISASTPPAGMRSFIQTLREEVAWATPASTPAALARTSLDSTIAGWPDDLPPISLGIRAISLPGGLYLSTFSMDTTVDYAPYLMALDDQTDLLFSKKTSSFCFDFKRQENGSFTYFQGDAGCFIGLDSAFHPVAAYRASNGYTTDGHELRLLPNGHALLLAVDQQFVDMSKLVAGGRPDATVIGNVIQELDRSGDVVFEWRSFDHFSITDATLTNFQAQTIDAVHSNALEVDADGNLLLSSRHLDEITKISRVTGDIIWRWGGKNNQFGFLGATPPFSHQHAIRRLANGHYTLFDNGNGHVPPLSRAVEYELDTMDMTATLVWQYSRPSTYSPAMGYVQRLEDGNTLVGWGATTPAVTVVNPAGTIMYELSLPGAVFSYRAYSLPWAGATTAVGAHVPVPSSFALEQNYPNPCNPTATIQYVVPHASHVTLSVYDALGQQAMTLVDADMTPGTYTALFDGARLASGVYFYRLQARPPDPAEGVPGLSGHELENDAMDGSESYVDTKKLLLIH
jgi:hypothetical protein